MLGWDVMHPEKTVLRPEKPILILHTDNFITKGNWRKPRQHGRIQSLAAAELLRRGDVSYVVIPGGVTTPGQPPVSDVMKVQISRNLAYNPEYTQRVISLGTARNTLEEVTQSRSVAGSGNSRKTYMLLDVAPEGQADRVKRIVRKHLGWNVPIYTSEEILAHGLTGGGLLVSMAKRAVANHRASREYRWYAYKNRRLNKIESFPGGVRLVALISKLLPDKGKTESTIPDSFK